MPHKFNFSTRLNSFKARPDLYAWKRGPADVTELIERASTVTGLGSIQLNFPEHFGKSDLARISQFVKTNGVTISGINLRYPEQQFLDGAFTNPAAPKRAEALALTCRAIDTASELGASHVIIWPGQDGFDYPFQIDYAQAWDWEIEGLCAVTAYRRDMHISIEYKPKEPRRYSVLANLAATLLAVQACGAPNLGITLDFCHMLMADEQPAMSAALCIQKHLLSGVHLNDGYGKLDDGLMVGSVNLMPTVELIYYLIKANFDGMVYFDTFPVREDPVTECTRNIQTVQRIVRALARLDNSKIADTLARQDALGSYQLISEALLLA